MGNEESYACSQEDAEEAAKGACPNGAQDWVQPNANYAVVHFRGGDKVFVIYGDEELRKIIEKQLNNHIGVSGSEMYGDEIFYIKTTGYPFSSVWAGAAPDLKQAGAEVLRELFVVGWTLVTTSNLARTNGVGSWFFRRSPDGASALSKRCFQPNSFPILSTSSTDKVNILNFPEYRLLIQVIHESYSSGIQNIADEGEDWVEIKLCGRPWQGDGYTKTAGVLLVMRLMAAIEERGYAFYGSANFKGSSDTLFFAPAGCPNPTPVEGYIAVILDDKDTLEVYQAQEDLISAIGSRAVSQWIEGVQHEESRCGGYAWKLYGNPWWSTGLQADSARRMMIALFSVLSANQYEHYATLDLSRKLSSKSTIFFRACREKRGECEFAAVRPGANDKLFLIGFPENGPECQLVRDAAEKTWPDGIQDELRNMHGTEIIQLCSNPFAATVFDWASEWYAREMMCAVMAALNNTGWKVVSSCDISAKCDHDESCPIGLDVWFVAKSNSLNSALPASPLLVGSAPASSMTLPVVGAPPSYEEAMNLPQTLPPYRSE